MKLFCGDWATISKELENDSIDCIVTDPPFGVDFDNEIYNDSSSAIKNQMLTWLKEMYRVLKEKSHCYIYIGVKTIHLWIENAIRAGFQYKNLISTKIYESYKYAGGSNFKFNFQPIIYLSKGNPKQFNRVDFFPTSVSWFCDKRNKNPSKFTYSYSAFIDKDICFSNVKTNKILKHSHNSEKNIKLIKFFIEVSTKKGEIVLDPFMGSGSTGIAAKLVERDFVGVELNKNIFNITREKIE